MPKIIAISGSGRSGSTLLSLLLSQDPQVFNLGQLRDLWRSYEHNQPCSCGQPLQQCEIYGDKVVNGLHLHSLGRDFLADAGKTARWSDRAATSELKERHAKYLQALQTILADIAAATGASHFIDSSKSPEMALAFSLLDEHELYLLNLIRDPRAVVCSWYKKKQSYSAVVKNARDWAARQRRLEEWKPALGQRTFTLRYEDLASKPVDAIESIAEWAELPLPDALFESANRAHIEWSNQHLFPPANERVLRERQSNVTIAVADSWQDPANRWLHRLTQIFAGSIGNKYYPKSFVAK